MNGLHWRCAILSYCEKECEGTGEHFPVSHQTKPHLDTSYTLKANSNGMNLVSSTERALSGTSVLPEGGLNLGLISLLFWSILTWSANFHTHKDNNGHLILHVTQIPRTYQHDLCGDRLAQSQYWLGK